MSKIRRVKINHIMVLAILLMPMQHAFAQIAGAHHNNAHKILSSSHHDNLHSAYQNVDNNCIYDEYTDSMDCNTSHDGTCGDNCSGMNHCHAVLISTFNDSQSRILEFVSESSYTSMGITVSVETHPPQTSL